MGKKKNRKATNVSPNVIASRRTIKIAITVLAIAFISSTGYLLKRTFAPKMIAIVATTQYKNLKIGLSNDVRNAMGDEKKAEEIVGLACEVAQSVQGSSRTTEVCLMMRDELEEDDARHQNPELVGAVTSPTIGGPTYIYFLKPKYVRSDVAVHEFSHLYMGQLTEILPYMLLEGYAGLCALVAEQHNGALGRSINANAMNEQNVAINRLNTPGIAHGGARDDPLMTLQYQAMSLAMYDLHAYHAADYQTLTRYLFGQTKKLSWKEFLSWARVNFPEWVARHQILQWPTQGVHVFTAVTLLENEQRILVIVCRGQDGEFAKRHVEVVSGKVHFESDVDQMALINLDHEPFRLADRSEQLVVRPEGEHEIRLDYPKDLRKQ